MEIFFAILLLGFVAGLGLINKFKLNFIELVIFNLIVAFSGIKISNYFELRGISLVLFASGYFLLFHIMIWLIQKNKIKA